MARIPPCWTFNPEMLLDFLDFTLLAGPRLGISAFSTPPSILDFNLRGFSGT